MSKSGMPTIFDPWGTWAWPTVRVMRHRQHKRDGTLIQADWLTNFSLARLGSRTFFKLAKSRWETENQGCNDGKNCYGMEHIQHHHPNSLLLNWLFPLTIHFPLTAPGNDTATAIPTFRHPVASPFVSRCPQRVSEVSAYNFPNRLANAGGS